MQHAHHLYECGQVILEQYAGTFLDVQLALAVVADVGLVDVISTADSADACSMHTSSLGKPTANRGTPGQNAFWVIFVVMPVDASFAGV